MQDLLELAAGTKDSLHISREALKTLDIHMVEVRPAPPPEPLRLPGSIFLDPGRMVRAHSRFDGEVVSIGTISDTSPDSTGPAKASVRFASAIACEKTRCWPSCGARTWAKRKAS